MTANDFEPFYGRGRHGGSGEETMTSGFDEIKLEENGIKIVTLVFRLGLKGSRMELKDHEWN